MPQYRSGKRSPWVVQYRAIHGKRAGKVCTRSFKTKADAIEFENFITQTKQRTRAGLEAPIEQILVIDFARSWLKKRFKDLPASTVSQDEGRLRNYWLEDFGSRPLTSITSHEILAKLDEIQYDKGHSPADRNRHRALLHRFYKDAIMEGKAKINPVAVIPLKEEKPKKRIALNEREQADYLEALNAQGEEYWILGMGLLWTGGRICSVNVIQLQDISWESGVIVLRRLEERITGKIVERQKSGAGEETTVPLFPALASALKFRIKRLGLKSPTDFVFGRPDGRFIPYDTFKDVHARAVKASEVRRITPHDLRRTFASNAEKAGYSKSEIKDMLGHSTVLMTEKYTVKDVSHLVEKGKRIGFGGSKLVRVGGKS
jgi:integrase